MHPMTALWMAQMITMQALTGWALTTLISAFVGSYLAAYLRRKGENLATHEDIDKLVEQVRAVTTATREIEAKISDQVWDRQKRWELKRDILLDSMRKTNDLENAISTEHAAFSLTSPSLQHRAEAMEGFSKAADAFDQASCLAELMCGTSTTRAMSDYLEYMRKTSQQVARGNPLAFTTTLQEMVTKRDAVRAAIKSELGKLPSEDESNP
jgi:hypothetical protein